MRDIWEKGGWSRGIKEREEEKKPKKENSFLTYGGNGVRHMGKRGCVGELKNHLLLLAHLPQESARRLLGEVRDASDVVAPILVRVEAARATERTHPRRELLAALQR